MDENLIQLLSVIIAGVGALTSAFFAIRARRDTRIAQQTQFIALRRQYYSDLQKWADAAVEALTSAIFLCELDPNKVQGNDAYNRWLSIKEKLSTLIDQGRFFLPNEAPDEHGQYKPPAYRGYRPPSLSRLVASFKMLEKFDSASLTQNGDLHLQLWELRKEFVSEIQKVLDPREREEEMKELQKDVKR